MVRVMTGSLALFLLAAASLSAEDKKSDFFNGENLDGWQGLEQYWSVKDGAIVASTAPDGLKFNTFLCSKKQYGDFALSFEVRLKGGKGNSGVQVRSEIVDDEKFVVKGPQCDIGQQYWGSLYGEKLPGGMMQAAPKDLVKDKVKQDGFNNYEIKVVGKHVTIKINGATMVDSDFEKMPAKGIIAFQAHAGGPMEVTFRNIKFKDLSK